VRHPSQRSVNICQRISGNHFLALGVNGTLVCRAPTWGICRADMDYIVREICAVRKTRSPRRRSNRAGVCARGKPAVRQTFQSTAREQPLPRRAPGTYFAAMPPRLREGQGAGGRLNSTPAPRLAVTDPPRLAGTAPARSRARSGPVVRRRESTQRYAI
jgi:hypothetical protein